MTGQLTALAVESLVKTPGRHPDGAGLFLRVIRPGLSYWIFRYRLEGREREMSLGAYPEMTLAEARRRHAAAYKAVKVDKRDPVGEKRAAREAQPDATGPTFDKVAHQFLDRQEARGQLGKNPVHRAQWRWTLTKLLPESFRCLPVGAITPKHVFDALDPIWSRTPETGSRTRGRIEAVLEFAREHDDLRPNPATWSGWLKTKLGNPRALGKIDRRTGKRITRGGHAAMPYAAVPAFIKALGAAPGVGAQALAFVILTAARSGEVFGMTWEEVDLDTKVWTVPKERMKMGVEHQVPLSDAALAILRRQFETREKNPHVFPGAKPREPLSSMALAMTMRRLKVGEFTPHGFRSSFRDWAADHGVEFDVAEQCLAHAIGSSVTRAYLRTTMIERRRKVMADWAAFLAGESKQATVVPFAVKRSKRVLSLSKDRSPGQEGEP
jgi:integrase